MATGNFYLKNASRYYVVEFEEPYQYGTYFEYLTEVYKDKGWYSSDKAFDRNTTDIMYKYFDIPSYGDRKAEPLEFRIHIVFNNGYYEAGNLDYRMCMYSDCEYDCVEDLAQDLLDEWLNDDTHKWGGVTMVERREGCRKYIIKHIEKAMREVERILKHECHDIYGVAARFSNGGIWYNKIK